MLQKNGFILFISELQRLLCNKNRIDKTISWGKYFSPLILDDPETIGTKVISGIQGF